MNVTEIRRRPMVVMALLMSMLLTTGWQLWWQKHPPITDTEEVKATLGQLPLSFIENQGQLDPSNQSFLI
jgi:hypothetical protein